MPNDTDKKKIAIACQGGGSHTAFTAGVLTAMFDNNNMEPYEVVGLSGTSGGAVCAALVWKCLQINKKENIGETLDRFWTDNATQYPGEVFLNDCIIGFSRWCSWLAHVQPSNLFIDLSCFMYKFLATSRDIAITMNPCLLPFYLTSYARTAFFDFESLINRHFEPFGGDKTEPALLIGATEIQKNKYKVFRFPSSESPTLEPEHLLASSAIPRLFEAVDINGESYWDGLFSNNPPMDELYDRYEPANDETYEIWIIQINPERRDSEAPLYNLPDVLDRRNELIGNISLRHNIDQLKETIKPGNKKIELYLISIPELRKIHSKKFHYGKMDFDYFSKSDRNSHYIEKLKHLGENVGHNFMNDKSKFRIP